MLSDGVVSLRPWSRADATFMAQSSSDPAIQRYNGDLDRAGWPTWPLSTARAEALIDTFVANWSAFISTGIPDGVVFAIVDAKAGELAGCCGMDGWSKTDVAQFGYWLAPSGRGKGYATRAAILFTRWLFDRGASRVFLTIIAGNEASIAVARRAGFELEGTMRALGVWKGGRCDVMMFAALRDEWAPPHPETGL